MVSAADDQLSAREASRWRSWVSMSLANLQQAHIWWSSSQRRLFARTTRRLIEDCQRSRRGASALPLDARYVGTYSQGIRAREVIEDLEALMVRFPCEPTTEPEQSAPATVATAREIPPITWQWAKTPFHISGGKPR